MKLLLDSCMYGQAAQTLRERGHDVIGTGSWEPDPGDRQILDYCLTERRVLVTLDKDFGDLAVAQGRPHPAMIRLVGFRTSQQAAAVIQLIGDYSHELAKGAILTAEPWRVPVRFEVRET